MQAEAGVYLTVPCNTSFLTLTRVPVACLSWSQMMPSAEYQTFDGGRQDLYSGTLAEMRGEWGGLASWPDQRLRGRRAWVPAGAIWRCIRGALWGGMKTEHPSFHMLPPHVNYASLSHQSSSSLRHRETPTWHRRPLTWPQLAMSSPDAHQPGFLCQTEATEALNG